MSMLLFDTCSLAKASGVPVVFYDLIAADCAGEDTLDKTADIVSDTNGDTYSANLTTGSDSECQAMTEKAQSEVLCYISLTTSDDSLLLTHFHIVLFLCLNVSFSTFFLC